MEASRIDDKIKTKVMCTDSHSIIGQIVKTVAKKGEKNPYTFYYSLHLSYFPACFDLKGKSAAFSPWCI